MTHELELKLMQDIGQMKANMQSIDKTITLIHEQNYAGRMVKIEAWKTTATWVMAAILLVPLGQAGLSIWKLLAK